MLVARTLRTISSSSTHKRNLMSMSSQAPTKKEAAAAPAKMAGGVGSTYNMEDIVNVCKRRGFVFQSSEIYNGFNGFYDYGPLGGTYNQ